MVFSSVEFIFRFLPIGFLIYFITPKKFKNLILVLLSLFFYSFGEGRYFIIMLLSVFVDYTLGRCIDKNKESKKKKVFLVISILFNLGMLFVFKYFNFFVLNINEIFNTAISYTKLTLPLGISFYTFQTMSYTIDVYRGKFKAEKNIIDFATFVCLFPQLIAGPIVKYEDIKKEIKQRRVKSEDLNRGIELFIIGMAFKVLLGNNLGILWNEITGRGFSEVTSLVALLGIICFTLQIYFDFNGYSLMAIGLGQALGFTFPKNFNYPYISRSATEMFRRWHITLGNFFKEYVYIPLGGSREGLKRTIRNLFVVWILTGLWHGAEYNFLIWGIYFFCVIAIEKMFLLKYLNKKKIISHIYFILVLLIGWSIFAITDLKELTEFFKTILSFSYDSEILYYIKNYIVIISIAIIFATPLGEKIYRKYIKNEWLKTGILMIIFVISIAYIVDGTYNPFLYFRF